MPQWQHNQNSRDQIELEKAKRLFEESEWVLNILRTQTATPPNPPTDKEIIEWHKNLKIK